MVTQTRDGRKEAAASRALARSALYQLLSQALSYPADETVASLRNDDLPLARQAAAPDGPSGRLTAGLARPLAALGDHLQDADTARLQAEHRRLFSHVVSPDCPPCETYYTARHLFQETQELSDIAGFFRAFGLQLSEKERLDHISVELEFMHFLTYKESYALMRHGPARARLCREAQRKFVEDHLGRWAIPFARRLGAKANGGYFGRLASLLQTFLAAEIAFLRARPDETAVDPASRATAQDGDGCPAAEDCPFG